MRNTGGREGCGATAARLQATTGTLEGLHSVGGGDLVGLGSGVLGDVAVQLHELGQVELGLLQHLHLADEDVLQGVDGVGLLLDLGGDRLRVGDPVDETRQTTDAALARRRHKGSERDRERDRETKQRRRAV